jgi:hypothetical protein
MEYCQYGKEYSVTTDEFIKKARNVYAYDVPTFKEAIRDLFRSFIRTRIINKAIPDLAEAIDYLESHEILSVPRVDRPSEFEFEQYQKGYRWMIVAEPSEEDEEEY